MVVFDLWNLHGKTFSVVKMNSVYRVDWRMEDLGTPGHLESTMSRR